MRNFAFLLLVLCSGALGVENCSREFGVLLYLPKEGTPINKIKKLGVEVLALSDGLGTKSKYFVEVPFIPSNESTTFSQYQAIMSKLQSDGNKSDEELSILAKEIKKKLVFGSVLSTLGSKVGTDLITEKFVITSVFDEALKRHVGMVVSAASLVVDYPIAEAFVEDLAANERREDLYKVNFQDGIFNVSNSLETYLKAGVNRVILLSRNHGSLVGNAALRKLDQKNPELSYCAAHVSLGSYLHPQRNFFNRTQRDAGAFGYVNYIEDENLQFMRKYDFDLYPENYHLIDQNTGYPRSFEEDLLFYLNPFAFRDEYSGSTVIPIDKVKEKLVRADEYLSAPKAPVQIQNIFGDDMNWLLADVSAKLMNFDFPEGKEIEFEWDFDGDYFVDCHSQVCEGVRVPNPFSGIPIRVSGFVDGEKVVEEELAWGIFELNFENFRQTDEDQGVSLYFVDGIKVLGDINGDSTIDIKTNESFVDFDFSRNFSRWAILKNGKPYIQVFQPQGEKKFLQGVGFDPTCAEEGFYIAPKGENPWRSLFLSKETGPVFAGDYKDVKICSGSSMELQDRSEYRNSFPRAKNSVLKNTKIILTPQNNSTVDINNTEIENSYVEGGLSANYGDNNSLRNNISNLTLTREGEVMHAFDGLTVLGGSKLENVIIKSSRSVESTFGQQMHFDGAEVKGFFFDGTIDDGFSIVGSKLTDVEIVGTFYSGEGAVIKGLELDGNAYVGAAAEVESAKTTGSLNLWENSKVSNIVVDGEFHAGVNSVVDDVQVNTGLLFIENNAEVVKLKSEGEVFIIPNATVGNVNVSGGSSLGGEVKQVNFTNSTSGINSKIIGQSTSPGVYKYSIKNSSISEGEVINSSVSNNSYIGGRCFPIVENSSLNQTSVTCSENTVAVVRESTLSKSFVSDSRILNGSVLSESDVFKSTINNTSLYGSSVSDSILFSQGSLVAVDVYENEITPKDE